MFSRRVAVANSKGWKGASSEHFSPPCGIAQCFKNESQKESVDLRTTKKKKKRKEKRRGGETRVQL